MPSLVIFDLDGTLADSFPWFLGVVNGVAPRRAIAIGDEVRDIEAARAAGIACGAVTWGYAAPEALTALKPDLVFERIEDIVSQLRTESGFR